MKKLSFILLVFIGVSLYAQETDQNFKPEKNNISFEVSFYPNDPFSPINLSYLRGRYFFSDKMALRMGFDYSSKIDKDESVNIVLDYSSGDIEYQAPNNVYENSYNIFGIHPGIEYHFANCKRISPYVGMEFLYVSKKSKGSVIDYDIESNYDYVNDIYTYSHTKEKYEYENCWIYGSERAYVKMGLNVILGTDVYITKHLYMGVEFGIGSVRVKDLEITEKNITDNIDLVLDPEELDKERGINVNSAIRLGFWF